MLKKQKAIGADKSLTPNQFLFTPKTSALMKVRGREVILGIKSPAKEYIYLVGPWVAIIFLPELASISGGNLRHNWVLDRSNCGASYKVGSLMEFIILNLLQL